MSAITITPSTLRTTRLPEVERAMSARAGSVEDWLQRIAKVTGEQPRQTGHGRWRCRCPAHDDAQPSLSVAVADDDGVDVVAYCFAGCAHEAVREAIGLPAGSGGAASGTRSARHKRTRDALTRHLLLMTSADVDRLIGAENFAEEALDAFQIGAHGKHRISAPERNAAGAIIALASYAPKYARERGLVGATKMTMLSAEKRNGRGLTYQAQGIEPGSEVAVVEGLACALAAQSLGFIAVGFPSVSRPFPERWASLLAECDVVVIPDADGDGQAAAKVSARAIAKTAARVRVAPPLEPWHDIADLLRETGSKQAAVEIAKVIERARLVERPKRGRPVSSRQLAVDYLRETLADGNWKLSSLVTGSRPEKVGLRTLAKARNELRVDTKRVREGWLIALPQEGGSDD